MQKSTLILSGLFFLSLGLSAQKKAKKESSESRILTHLEQLEQRIKGLEARLEVAENDKLGAEKQLQRRDAEIKSLSERLTASEAQNKQFMLRLERLEKGAAAGLLSPDKQALKDKTQSGSSSPERLTQVSIEEKTHNFGEIKMGDQVFHTFVIKNTGKEPLIIEKAMGSCGCTIPEYTQDPVAPGGEAKVKVHFNSNGKSGTQRNTVSLHLNTEPSEHRLEIIAEVKN